ncbi:MAG: iron ABC transporter permease [bacterium]|nr:iron ABC transporter permease [bacterium]
MKKKYTLISLAGVAVLVLLPFIGVIDINIQSLFSMEESADTFIFWQLRVPRTLLAFLVGSTLALSGLIFQNIFKNSLATPYTLGVSSGAAASTVVAIKAQLSISFLGLNGYYIYGFTGALITITIILAIAKAVKSFSIYTLLMSGIALNFFFSSFILMVQYLLDFTETVSVMRWLMGGLTISGYGEVMFLAPLWLFFVITTLMVRNELVLVSGGDQFAYSKGLDVKKFRVFIFIMVSFIVGVVVSMAGPIGFVGLIVPHISRLIFKDDFKAVICFTIFIGGLLLVVTDFLARILIPPVEIPVGIITSFMGAPFFLFILISKIKES